MPRPRDRPPPAVKCAQIKKPTPRNENMIKSGRIPNKVAIEIWSRATSLLKPPKPPKPPKRPNRACVELFTCLAHFWRLIHALWGGGGWGVTAKRTPKQNETSCSHRDKTGQAGTSVGGPELESRCLLPQHLFARHCETAAYFGAPAHRGVYLICGWRWSQHVAAKYATPNDQQRRMAQDTVSFGGEWEIPCLYCKTATT